MSVRSFRSSTVCWCGEVSIESLTGSYPFVLQPWTGVANLCSDNEGPYQDRPPLCPFRLLPLLIYSGSTIAFLEILKVQGPKSKNIDNVILLQP